MTFAELETIYKKHLFLDDDPLYLKTVFSVMLANRLDTTPVWLMIIGKASSGKSEICNSLHLCAETISIGKFNKKAFISHAKGEDGKDPSLLPKLDGKVMLISDISTMSTINPNDRQEVFAILRSAFDGRYSDHSGFGKKEYKSKFGIIACATPFFEYQNAFSNALGERFLYYRPELIDEALIWEKIQKSNGSESETKKEINETAYDFLDKHVVPEKVKYPNEILALAQILAVMRTEAIRDRFRREVDFPVETGESATRIGKQLAALYTAACSIMDKSEAMLCIKRVVRDTIPYVRLKIIRAVMSKINTTGKISEYIHLSYPETGRQIEDLCHLNILKASGHIVEVKTRIYDLSDMAKSLFKVRPML